MKFQFKSLVNQEQRKLATDQGEFQFKSYAAVRMIIH